MLSWLREGNNCVVGLSQEKSKVQCTYLVFQNLKISIEKVNSGQKAKAKVRMMFFDVKMKENLRP